MTKYRLLKDLPGLLAGSEIEYNGEDSRQLRDNGEMSAWNVAFFLTNRNDPVWFKEIRKKKSVNSILWKPEDEEDYYFINEENEVEDTYWISGDPSDEGRYLVGNIYKTEEEAQETLNQQFAYAELVRAIAKANESYGPMIEVRSSFVFLPDTGEIRVHSSLLVETCPREFTLRAEVLGEQIIEELGEDKIKLAMGWE